MSELNSIIISQGSETFKGDQNWTGVCTPHLFCGGRPAVYYIRQNGQNIELNDHGLNLHLFEDSLPDPNKASHTVERLLKQFDNNVHFNSGMLTTYSNIKDAEITIGQYLDVLSRMTNYTPKSVKGQDYQEVLDMIYNFLMLRNNNSIIVNSTAQGKSGTVYKFPFQSGKKLIEYAQPNAEKTGRLLRKMFDVKNLDDEIKFQIILDDRNNKDNFKREGEILSSMASITPLSALQATSTLLH